MANPRFNIFFFQWTKERENTEKGKRRGCLCNPNRRNTPLYCGSFGPRISVCWKLRKGKMKSDEREILMIIKMKYSQKVITLMEKII